MIENLTKEYTDFLRKLLRTSQDNKIEMEKTFLEIELFWRKALPLIINEIGDEEEIIYYYIGDPAPSESFCSNIKRIKQAVMIPDVVEKIKIMFSRGMLSIAEVKVYVKREFGVLEDNNSFSIPVRLYTECSYEPYDNLLEKMTNSVLDGIFQSEKTTKYDINELNDDHAIWIKNLFVKDETDDAIVDIIKSSELYLMIKRQSSNRTDSEVIVDCIRYSIIGPLSSFASMIIFRWIPIVENPSYMIVYSGLAHLVEDDSKSMELYVRMIAANLLMNSLNKDVKGVDLSKLEQMDLKKWFQRLKNGKEGMIKFKQCLKRCLLL
ncbi:hypothetical protein [Levilactobacillus sp. N40-8-2]|uniref:hypothetical protein n=1 Tax=Levilactobacillus muriae TaxID=3238987 RepID=UPI0038B3A6E4